MRPQSKIVFPAKDDYAFASLISGLHFQGLTFTVELEDNNYIITLDKLKL